MTRLVLHLLLIAISAAVSLPSPTATAQPASSDEAKIKTASSYVDAGIAAQDAGDYDAAITFYSKAYDLVQHPVLLFNIAQVHRLAGHGDQAIEFYRQFLATNPTGPEAQLARKLVAELEAREAKDARRAAAALQVEQNPKAEQALTADEARRPDEPHAEGSRDLAISARPSPQALRGPSGVWSPRRKIAVGIASGGVLALAAGGVLGVSAKSKQSDAHDLCSDPQVRCDDADRANELIRSGHDRSIGANVAFGVGAAAVLAAGVLWFTGAPQLPDRISVTPAASPGQVVVTASGSF